MKIEKIHDNQIRCTLTREDLAQRQIKLSELAYGTGKAQALFSEMIRFAAYKYGFEVDDSPLMVEAIPISSDTIVLIVTKVAYPEELDTRFSNFTKHPQEDQNQYSEDGGSSDFLDYIGGRSASEILDVASKVVGDSGDSAESGDEAETAGSAIQKPITDQSGTLTRIYSFSSIDDLFELSHVLSGYVKSDNTLYRIKGEGYYLVLRGEGQTPAEYNKICNVASEYGALSPLPGGAEHYFGEHRRPVLEHNALQNLAAL